MDTTFPIMSAWYWKYILTDWKVSMMSYRPKKYLISFVSSLPKLGSHAAAKYFWINIPSFSRLFYVKCQTIKAHSPRWHNINRSCLDQLKYVRHHAQVSGSGTNWIRSSVLDALEADDRQTNLPISSVLHVRTTPIRHAIKRNSNA